ncbi:protein-tyrosine-phosphatase [Brumimicrobium salinarum]|uniref:Protein-tyrosine-phosphatase n=1 Tax=Brumimicrobium salinarum TaxID=2058658 RepID=A0A2I0R6N4_9FLAO|nr:protein-tyrosine-phosphatase [Brumimicrobium salinarum]PKR82209.1 protein-tyrosine-phosphatase [Brumimicrobium salinarum]
MKLFDKLEQFTSQIDITTIDEKRKNTLQPLIEFIQEKVDKEEAVKLNFICTHNSRRSHLAQIWAQTMAHYYGVSNINCFSGGTEATAIYPAVIETLKNTGFNICTITSSENPKYSIKFTEEEASIVAFSKRWNDLSNPKDSFCAIMTCSEADGDCPVVLGAEKRFPIHYNDPKVFDHSPSKMEEYNKTSIQTATEMSYVFSQIKVKN